MGSPKAFGKTNVRAPWPSVRWRPASRPKRGRGWGRTAGGYPALQNGPPRGLGRGPWLWGWGGTFRREWMDYSLTSLRKRRVHAALSSAPWKGGKAHSALPGTDAGSLPHSAITKGDEYWGDSAVGGAGVHGELAGPSGPPACSDQTAVSLLLRSDPRTVLPAHRSGARGPPLSLLGSEPTAMSLMSPGVTLNDHAQRRGDADSHPTPRRVRPAGSLLSVPSQRPPLRPGTWTLRLGPSGIRGQVSPPACTSNTRGERGEVSASWENAQ